MMFSTKAEYGVRVMVELARRAQDCNEGRRQGDPLIPLAEIAEQDDLPLAYLEHLVARLRKAGLVDSRRGSRGGYMLARPAAEIAMADVVEALEGSIAPIECVAETGGSGIRCSRAEDSARPVHACPTKLLWTRVQLAIVGTLRQTTLADLLGAEGPAPQSLLSLEGPFPRPASGLATAEPMVEAASLPIEPEPLPSGARERGTWPT